MQIWHSALIKSFTSATQKNAPLLLHGFHIHHWNNIQSRDNTLCCIWLSLIVLIFEKSIMQRWISREQRVTFGYLFLLTVKSVCTWLMHTANYACLINFGHNKRRTGQGGRHSRPVRALQTMALRISALLLALCLLGAFAEEKAVVSFIPSLYHCLSPQFLKAPIWFNCLIACQFTLFATSFQYYKFNWNQFNFLDISSLFSILINFCWFFTS